MCAVLTDFLAAGAKAGDRSNDFLSHGNLSVCTFGSQNHVVVHCALKMGDGSGFFHEEGEGQADIAAVRLQGSKHFLHDFDHHLGSERLIDAAEQGPESGHVGPLLVCGQGNIHFDIGHSVLCASLAFYQNRGSDPFDANATNGNISSVSRRLDIRKNH